MRILQVDKFLRRNGGSAGYMLDLANLQRERGDVVDFFAMSDPLNLESDLALTYPPQMPTEVPPAGRLEQTRVAARMVWSIRALQGFRRALDSFRPDVVHLHSIYHQLSPSILKAVRENNIPCVMTVHDYKLVCPSYRMLANGLPCEKCVEGSALNAIVVRCKDDSLARSTVLGVESLIHRVFRLYRGVDSFVAPSRFLFDLLSRGNRYPGRIVHLPHFAEGDGILRNGAGEGFLYAGRLSSEKGVDTLIRAVGHDLRLRLTIAGDGPLRGELEHLSREVAPGQISFAGHVDKPTLMKLMRDSRATVLPATWYENQPLSVLESMACGVPAVVTALGGLTELIDPMKTGLHVTPGDSRELADALRILQSDENLSIRMGAMAAAEASRKFGRDDHLRSLDEVYHEAISRRNPSVLSG